MKKQLIYLFALLLVVTSTSCEKFLEIEPEGEIPASEALQTPEDLQLLLNSCYDALRSDNFYGGKYMVLSELMSDNLDGRLLQGNYLSYFQHNTTIFNQDTRDVWAEPYRVIYRCNVLLDNINIVPGVSQGDIDRITAEAKFIRALAHFDIVRMFAQPYGFTSDNSHLGIPLRLSATQEQLNRSTVAEVYDAVITDLEEAAAVLPAENNNYATSWAAKAILARVYFQQGNHASARDMANDIIENGPFALDSDVMARYSQAGTNENIFVLVSTGSLNHSGSGLQGNYRSDGGQPPGLRIAENLYNIATVDTADLRGQNWYIVQDAGQPNQLVFSARFNNVDFFNQPIIHLAEVILIRAESRALTGDVQGGTDDLNMIRSRAIPTAAPLGGLSQAVLVQAIRDERRLEMVCEGNRIQDLKRQGVLGESIIINGNPWNCNGMAVQLPDDEFSGNPDIQLNPEGC